MADEMQPIYTTEPARVPAIGDGGEFQTFKKPSVYVPFVQYDSIESLSVYGGVEGVSSIYVNSHQYVLPIPKPLTAGDVWHSKVKSSYDERIVLDGTEVWARYARISTVGGNFYEMTIPKKPKASNVQVTGTLSSHLTCDNAYTKKSDCVWAFVNTQSALSTLRIGFSDDSIDTAEKVNAYLAAQKAAGTPVVVYYQSTAYDGTNGLTVSVADYQSEIYANNFVDIFTDDGELWVDGGDFVEVAVNNIVLNGMTNDERAGEYGTPQVHTFP